MLWTVVKADFIYTLMTLPLFFSLQLGIALYQKRAARIASEKQEAGWAKQRARNKIRNKRLFGHYRRRLPVAIYRSE